MASRPGKPIPSITDVDIRLLQVFRAIVECGGFSAAEVELNISRSTISTHMSDLESRLGMTLCRRGRAGFSLTDEGRAVYAASDRLLVGIETFRAEVAEARGHLSGEIKIGVIDNTVTDPQSRLAAAIAALKARGDDVHVTIQISSPNDIERAVLNGSLHVGVGAFQHRAPGLDYGELYEEDLGLFCGRGNVVFDKAAGRPTAEDISKSEHATHGYLSTKRRDSVTDSITPTAIAYHMEGMAMLVLSGRYTGYLPLHYAQAWVARNLIREIRPDLFRTRARMQAITRKGGRPTLVQRTFLEELYRLHGRAAEAATAAGT